MKVFFKNNYSTQVWVAIMKYNPDMCPYEGKDWSTHGWFNLVPGEEKFVFSTNNKYACFYAEADDGAHWAGDYGPVYVYYEAFDMCLGIATTNHYDIVGMRLLSLSKNRDLRVNINP